MYSTENVTENSYKENDPKTLNWDVVFEKTQPGENFVNKIIEKLPIVLNERVLACQFKLSVILVINSRTLTDCKNAQKQ